MPARPPLTALPEKLELGLALLARGHELRHGGKVASPRFSEKVLELFNRLEEAGIDWVMVGAEAVNLYIERPRATVDIDLVVRAKHVPRAKKIVRELCGRIEDTEVHFRSVLSPEPMRLELDVIKSQSHALFEEALDRQVTRDGVRVPRIEALLALKFLSSVSPWRGLDDRRSDVVDFGRVYRQNRPAIDRGLLIDLASRAHERAREEFEKFLDAIENDRPIVL